MIFFFILFLIFLFLIFSNGSKASRQLSIVIGQLAIILFADSRKKNRTFFKMQKDKFDRQVTLLRKYYSGTLEKREKQEFREMLNDRNLENVFRQLSQGDILAEKLEEYKQYDARKAFGKFSRQQKSLRHKKRIIRILTAAVVVLLLGMSWLLNQISYAEGKITYRSTPQIQELAYNELIVPTAGECYITLEDHTKVWINAESKIKYPVQFTAGERKVYLEGEAYFDVAEDGRPFQVITSQGEVTVLGTAFGISSYMDKAEYTTLVRGCVRYTSHTKKSVILSPGEQAILERSGELISRKVEVEEYVGWKDGVFVFRDKPLEEIMETLSRWYGSEVVFRNEEMKQLKYTGSLERYDSINTFLQVLERLQDIHYEIDNNKILLSRKSS